MRVADGVQQALGDLLARLAQAGVQRGDHDVQLGQDLVRVVQRAIGPDLDLGALQQADRIAQLALHGVDLRPAAGGRLRRQPAGHAQAGGVVGDRQHLAGRARGPPPPSRGSRACPSLQVECECSSALDVSQLDQARAACPAGPPAPRRGLRAARAGSRAAPGRRRLLLRWRTGSRVPSLRAAGPARRATGPCFRASSRRRTLWSLEPVAYCRAVPKRSGGCTHNWARRPLLNSTLDLVSPCPATRDHVRMADEGLHHRRRIGRRRPAGRCRRRWRACGAGCRRASAAYAGQLPQPGQQLLGERPGPAQRDAVGAPARALRCPAMILASDFSPMPGRSRSLPARAAASSSARLVTPSSFQNRPTFLGPRSGTCSSSTRRGRHLAFSFSRNSSLPVRAARRSSRRWPCPRRGSPSACPPARPR